jgi:ferritin-like metal-binding protein YciE
VQTLEDLLVQELHDLHSAEQQMVMALPAMAQAARSDRLRRGFEGHVEQTRHRLDRLEQILQELGPAGSTRNAPAETVDVLMPGFGELVPVDSARGSSKQRGALLDDELGTPAPTSQATHGMIEEGRILLEQNAEPHVKDFVLITEAQCIEQYKAAGYAAAHSHARLLGHVHAENLLAHTLREANETSGKLTELAECEINVAAAGSRPAAKESPS